MLYKHLKTGKIGKIANISIKGKGLLYTFKYNDGTYGRYYESALPSNFVKVKQAEQTKTAQNELTNVIRVDFVKKQRIA